MRVGLNAKKGLCLLTYYRYISVTAKAKWGKKCRGAHIEAKGCFLVALYIFSLYISIMKPDIVSEFGQQKIKILEDMYLLLEVAEVF